MFMPSFPEVDEQLAKAAPTLAAREEPLFKGLGTIGRVGNMVGSIASQIASIQRGYEQWSTNKDGGPPDDADQHAAKSATGGRPVPHGGNAVDGGFCNRFVT